MRQTQKNKSPEDSEVQSDIFEHQDLQEVTERRKDMIWLATQV